MLTNVLLIIMSLFVYSCYFHSRMKFYLFKNTFSDSSKPPLHSLVSLNLCLSSLVSLNLCLSSLVSLNLCLSVSQSLSVSASASHHLLSVLSLSVSLALSVSASVSVPLSLYLSLSFSIALSLALLVSHLRLSMPLSLLSRCLSLAGLPHMVDLHLANAAAAAPASKLIPYSNFPQNVFKTPRQDMDIFT